MLQLINLVYGTLNLYYKLLQNYWKITVKKLKQKLCCCNPLTMAEGKKLRLATYFRRINKRIKQNRLRYKNLNTLAEMSKCDYFG